MKPPDARTQLWMLTQMLRIRTFEERVKRTFTEHPGVIRGHTHLADGTEASIVGSLSHFRAGDAVLATYRCHGYPLVLGSDPGAVMAEIYGRAHGLCRGLGGSMHLADVKHGFLGTSAIVGAGIPHAAGAAWAAQIRGKGEVVLSFFGDGATQEGAFYETLNIASLWKLPVVFVLENDELLAPKAKARAMPGIRVDGTCPLAVHATVGAAIERARAGRGPTLVESRAFRGDPVLRFRRRLIRNGILTAARADALTEDVSKEMQEAVTFALDSPFPKPESALEHNYA